MNVLLIGIGSLGDVKPLVRLGVALKSRRHRVTVAANGDFEDLIRRAGLEAVAFGAAAEQRGLLSHPDINQPAKAPIFFAKHFMPPVTRRVYEIVSQYDRANTVVVGSCLAFGARIAQDKTGIPLATIYLQPAYLPSVYQTPKLSGIPLPNWLPRPLKRMALQSVDRTLDKAFSPGINNIRTEQGLPALECSYSEWMDSPQLVIGLFPAWFAPLQPDWPSQIRLTGFLNCARDVDKDERLTPELARVLDSGEPPILFTSGSWLSNKKRFFEESINACRLLGRGALLVTRFRDQIPDALPDGISHFEYVPFSLALPRVAAIVHPGGIGTIAQALAAGAPQLIVPQVGDHPDNAARVERLGAGVSVSLRKYRGKLVAERLDRLLNSDECKSRLLSIQKKIHEDRAAIHALDDTCALIEQLRS
jgi:rhamnosyltransferase subunit B